MHRATTFFRGITMGMAGVATLAACPPYATPPPQHFTSATVDTIAFDSIRAYAHTLKFDTVLGAADAKRVKFDSTGRSSLDALGDSAWIQPESGAWALTPSALAQGRIIARVKTNIPHPPTGYGPWWTWWWVDKHGPPGDTAWRSLLLSDSLATRHQDSLTLTIHKHPVWHQSIARWGSQWSTCSRSACCNKE